MPLILPDTMDYQGRRFLRARWTKPYLGVVAQYREDKPRDSGHMFVMEDGSITIPHNDLWNPDASLIGALMHAMTDDCARTVRLGAAIVAGFWLGRLKQWRKS